MEMQRSQLEVISSPTHHKLVSLCAKVEESLESARYTTHRACRNLKLSSRSRTQESMTSRTEEQQQQEILKVSLPKKQQFIITLSLTIRGSFIIKDKFLKVFQKNKLNILFGICPLRIALKIETILIIQFHFYIFISLSNQSPIHLYFNY